MEQLRAGEAAAWEEAYASYYGLVISVLGGRGNSLTQEDLEDVAIGAITKLIAKYVETAENIEELSKLVITIAKNEARDLLESRNAEKRGGGKVESIEDQPEGREFAADALNPAQNAAQVERAFLVDAAVQQLPERYRDVVADFYFLGLKQQEIADKRGLKIGSIGVYLSRGLELLEPILKNLDLL